jgi:putative ABC transport system permease protein
MVTEIMSKRHQKDDFVVVTPETVRNFLNIFNWTISLYLGFASLIALFISGFVMSNIFSINVKVRAWEIGIRRALGATRRAIIYQFMAEALTISFFGAILGSLTGFLAILLVTPLLKIPTVYPLESLILAIVFSFATGLLSVFMPARAAAYLNTVHSLKSRL